MPDPNAISVSTGFTWTSFFTGISGASLLGILALVIRQIGPWRKQRDEAEQKLRTELLKRIGKLEKQLDTKERHHEAERALDRHKINNLTQCLDAVLMVLEAAPEKTVEVVARIKTMREAQILAEAKESAAIYAAKIADAKELEHADDD